MKEVYIVTLSADVLIWSQTIFTTRSSMVWLLTFSDSMFLYGEWGKRGREASGGMGM